MPSVRTSYRLLSWYQDLRPFPHLVEPVQEGRVQRKGQQTPGRLQRPQGAVPAVMHAPPGPLQLIPRSLPLVELPLPDLAPALEAAHF